ncbi:MAG: phosphoribosylaminoimidazolesuccinocarboxamide synthase [Deltaproteobacteria bacterium RIFOXYB12_FULL_58_9]|nr:MAG: phosphoribosylaminoimidazolesuccinocarboxamide synthase [Deltaproteobacteria bacterium RIFOXYB12_FULL_58_9]
MTQNLLLNSDLDLPVISRGKVRDNYDLGDKILLVASDRLSAFDVVFKEGIPDKGRVLTHVSLFWVDKLAACKPYHLVTANAADMGPKVAARAAELNGRVMLAEKLEMIPVECVVRGHLVGSGWKDYKATGKVCGHDLPAGMQQGDRFDEPLFTPSTKADMGDHDENISFERAVELVGSDIARELRDRSISIFKEAAAYARERSLILVDTKFEFGRRADGTVVLADEVLTPDSSRYWDLAEAEATERGKTPPSFDKQVVRDYLETLNWNKQPPPPSLPTAIIDKTAGRYHELVERLTGSGLTSGRPDHR